ncbi:MAG: twin-arginine translocation signal domain-containing protein [Coriobacteriia bacterium]|nr:twin-arginine translocation signal domain-containing protein [Coriobacteriia bacterium]
MTTTKISRRQFLGGAAGAAAVVGAATLPFAMNVSTAAATPPQVFPLAIDTGGWVPLDAKACARQAYEIYKGKWAGHSACCEATYWPIVGVLAARYPTTWGNIPMGMFNYGGGGVNSYGSICGCPNGASALLSQISATTGMKMNFMSWYEKTALPSNAASLDYLTGTWSAPAGATGGWADYLTAGATQIPIPTNNLPSSTSGNVLCHVSLTKWRVAADQFQHAYSLTKDLQSQRCGALCYDAVYYLATLINTWKAGGTIDGSTSVDASTAGCKATACHGSSPTDPLCDSVTAQGSMKCSTCHSM